MSIRAHYSNTVLLLLRYGYLLLLPLLRLLIPGSNIWNETVLMQAATLAGMILLFEIYRRTSRLTLLGGVLTIERGILLRSRSRIPLKGRAILHFKAGILPRMLGGVRMTLETDTGLHKRTPLDFYLSLPQARQIALQAGFDGQELAVHARTGLKESFTCAVFSSDSHLGFLALAPLFKAVANLFDVNPAGELIGAVSRLELTLIRSIPPLFTTIAALLIAGYLLSLLYLTERHGRFTLYTGAGKYAVTHGLLTRYTTLLPTSAFPAVTARSGLLMRACALAQPIAVTPNPALTGGKRTFLLPICSVAQAEELLFHGEGAAAPLRIPKAIAWRVYIPVLALSGGGCAAGFLGAQWFPALRVPFSAAGMLLIVTAVAVILPCALRERRAFLSLPDAQGENTRRFTLEHTRLHHCAAYCFRQTPFQYREHLYTVELRPRFSGVFRLAVNDLPAARAGPEQAAVFPRP